MNFLTDVPDMRKQLEEKLFTKERVIDLLKGIKEYRNKKGNLPFGTLDYIEIDRAIKFLKGFDEILEKIDNHILQLLEQFKNTPFVEDYRNRIDEVFLLYSAIKNITFVEVCKKFQVDYELFNKITNYNEKDFEHRQALIELKRKLKGK